MQLWSYPTALVNSTQTTLELELEAMLKKTLSSNEAVHLKVQAAPGEAFVVTSLRVIILKSMKRDPAAKGYGRFFSLDSIIRFERRGFMRTDFIAVITPDTVNEVIPTFNAWKCSFGTSFVGDLGRETANYLKRLEQWIDDQRRTLLLTGPRQPIVSTKVVSHAGEHFYLEAPATYYEERSVRQYVGGSSSLSFPVVRGVRMRVGGSRGRSMTESVLQENDRGTLVIGDKRIVFSGSRRNIEIPLVSIATVEAFSNGFVCGVSNNKTTQFRTANDLPGLLLKHLLQIP